MKVRRNLLIALSLLSLGANAQRIKGSDTVLPVAQQTAERFMNQHPEARVTVTGGGTGVGISALMDHTTDIAMASRPIKFSEKMKIKGTGEEVDEVIVAYDALAVVVHPSNPVKQLTRQQLEDIFHLLNFGEILLPRLVFGKCLHHNPVAVFFAFQFDTLGRSTRNNKFVVASERPVRVVRHTSLRLPEIMHQIIIGIE